MPFVENETRLVGPGTSQDNPLQINVTGGAIEDAQTRAAIEALTEVTATDVKLEELRVMLQAVYTRLGDGSQTSDAVPMDAIVGQGLVSIPIDAPVPLTTNLPCRSVTVRADSMDDTNKNSRPIFIGGPGVTATAGMVLRPGESFTIEIGNANAVYVIARSANQKACWVAAL